MAENMRDREEQAAEEARRWITRMASGEMRPDELAAFRVWRQSDPLHDRMFRDGRAIWRAAGSGPDARPVPDAGLSPFSVRQSWFGHHGRRLIMTGMVGAIVAGLVLGDDLSVMLRADHRAGAGVRSVTLADGSLAMLDAGTAIAVDFDAKERRIELLRGDAWFEVAHGDRRPFRVAALGGETQDIGTAFAVRREDDAVSVSVTEGVIEIRSPRVGRSLRLRASQRAHYAEGGVPVRIQDAAPDTIAAWRQGEILFDRADLRSAIATIARYRRGPVFILGKPVSPRPISGAFRIDRPDEAIDAIAGLNGLSVARFGGIALLRPAR